MASVSKVFICIATLLTLSGCGGYHAAGALVTDQASIHLNEVSSQKINYTVVSVDLKKADRLHGQLFDHEGITLFHEDMKKFILDGEYISHETSNKSSFSDFISRDLNKQALYKSRVDCEKDFLNLRKDEKKRLQPESPYLHDRVLSDGTLSKVSKTCGLKKDYVNITAASVITAYKDGYPKEQPLLNRVLKTYKDYYSNAQYPATLSSTFVVSNAADVYYTDSVATIIHDMDDVPMHYSVLYKRSMNIAKQMKKNIE